MRVPVNAGDGGGPTIDLPTQLLRAAGRVAGAQARQLHTLGLSPSASAVMVELAARTC